MNFSLHNVCKHMSAVSVAADAVAAKFGRALDTLVEGGGSDTLLVYVPAKVRDEAVTAFTLPAVLSAGGRDDFASITRGRLLGLCPEHGQLTHKIVAGWPGGPGKSAQLILWEGVSARPTDRISIRALAEVLGEEQAEAAVRAMEAARSGALPPCLDGVISAPWLPAPLELDPRNNGENTPPQGASLLSPSKRRCPVSEVHSGEEESRRPDPPRPHPHPHPNPPPTPSSLPPPHGLELRTGARRGGGCCGGRDAQGGAASRRGACVGGGGRDSTHGGHPCGRREPCGGEPSSLSPTSLCPGRLPPLRARRRPRAPPSSRRGRLRPGARPPSRRRPAARSRGGTRRRLRGGRRTRPHLQSGRGAGGDGGAHAAHTVWSCEQARVVAEAAAAAATREAEQRAAEARASEAAAATARTEATPCGRREPCRGEPSSLSPTSLCPGRLPPLRSRRRPRALRSRYSLAPLLSSLPAPSQHPWPPTLPLHPAPQPPPAAGGGGQGRD